MVRTRLAFFVVALVCAVVAAGCGSGSAPPGSAGQPATTPTSAVPAPTAAASPGTANDKPDVPQTLAFTGRTVDGKDFDAATLAGKPAVLWFWAPWCPKCRAAAPDVARTADRYAGKANVVGVAGLSNDAAAMRDFVTSTRTGALPHLEDAAGAVWKRFGVTTQHTYVLLAADGSVSHTGALSPAELADRVGKLAG